MHARFKALAASVCTNELLRKLRAILHTPANFAQPLLSRLARRSRHRLSWILNTNAYFNVSEPKCVQVVYI